MKTISIQITDSDYDYIKAKYQSIQNFHWNEEVRSSIRRNILNDHTSRKFGDLAIYNEEDIPKGQEWYVSAMINDSNFYEGLSESKEDYDDFNLGFDDSDYYVTSD